MMRKQAREAAFQTLFAQTFVTDSVPADYTDSAGDEAEYIKAVVLGVTANTAAIDARITPYIKGRTLNRISRVALTLMRMALYEPTAIEGVTQAVAINETVELCKQYDSEETAKYINGVLGSAVRGS